jgi:hypothetical protein
MKTKNTLILLLFAILCSTATAQDNKSNLYVYKTEADFFNGNKIYRGEYLFTSGNNGLVYRTEGSKKKRKLYLNDSCDYYFGFEHGAERRIRTSANPKDKTYYLFGGGNKNAYCMVYGSFGYYGSDGYLLSYQAIGGWVYMYFVDRVNNLNSVSIEEFLKSKPKLLEKYNAEKKETDEKVWERNQLATGIKYLKLFNADGQ